MNQKPNAFYFALQKTLRGETDRRKLARSVKRWRYTQSMDESQLLLKPETLRFLVRYGVLDAGKERDELAAEFRALATRISRASGEAPGVVAAWMELFSAGEFDLLPTGVCAEDPRCGVCGLKETCRYLAGGAKESRTSGQSLERELLSNSKTADRTVAELLSFIAAGERSGGADIARAEAVLKGCNGLRGVFLANPERLRELGLADAAIARLQAVAELCRSWAEETSPRGAAFTCGKDFYQFFYLRLRDLRQEVFVVVLLDQKNRMMQQYRISEGTLTETMAHPREVFARAIAERAAAVAVIHNHPSGDPSPSESDKAITTRLQSVAKLVGIRFLDHIIIGDGRFYSFVEEGELH